MPSYTTSVGNVELLCLNDGMPVRDPLTPFPDTTIEQWREFPELLDERDFPTPASAISSGSKDGVPGAASRVC